MLRTVVLLLMLTTLTGCICLPEKGESIDSNYFDNCWAETKKGHRNDGIFAKP